MRLKEYDVDPDDVAVGAVAASQTPAGAENLTLTSTTVTLDYARQLGITSASNISNRTLTFTGTDADGYSQTETVTGPNATTVETTKYFKTITQIAISGAAAGALTVDTVDEVATQTIPLDWRSDVAAAINVDVTGTIDFTVQQTFDDVQRPGSSPQSATQNSQWLNITALAAKTADTTSTASVGATAIRLLVNSYSSTAELQMNVVQTTSR